MSAKVETPISFLKPEYLLRAQEEYELGKISLAELRQVQDRAVAGLVRRQLAAGLDIATDGAYRQINGLRDFWMGLAGVSPAIVTSGHVFQDQNAGEAIPKVVSEIAFNPAHEIFDDFSFLLKEAGDGPVVRMDIPAPSLFYLELVRNEWYDRSAYPGLQLMARDIAKAYNETIRALYGIGCRRLLLIDTCWGRLCDRLGAKRLVQGGIDLASLPRTLLSINEAALEGLPADMRIVLYAPFETVLGKECEEIVKLVCSHRRVDALMVDSPDSDGRFGEFLGLVPEGKELILGIEDAKQPQTLTDAEVRERLSKVPSSMPAQSIRLTTRGGFANNTDTINFSAFDEPDQWRKIDNLMSFRL